MAVEELKAAVKDLIAEPLAREEAEIAELVLSRYKANTTVKVFLYSARGTTLAECARLSRLIGDMIDGTDLFASGYILEVSSPGLDRPLTELIDFKFRVGEQVKVEFEDKTRKKIAAKIEAVDGETVKFLSEDETITVPLAEIKQAKIIF